MTDRAGRRGLPWLRSIRVQACALAAILIALPLLIVTVLGKADAERRMLMLNAVTDTGDAIAAGIAPVLQSLHLADVGSLRRELSRFSADGRGIKILLRPADATTANEFFFVAIDPPISSEQTEEERRQLLDLQILPDLLQGCTARFVRSRDAPLLRGGAEVLTSAMSVSGVAGCWTIIMATSERRVLGAIEARPYRARREVQIAIAIYTLMALLIVAIFLGIWSSLRRFRRLALSSAEHPAFAQSTAVPELVSLASAFDSMVQRMKRSAEMLRQSAEDNAHAFKGPIGTIRQAIAGPTLAGEPEGAAWPRCLRIVSIALDRLEGLVQSARYLDTAAAELLEPELSRVDYSGLVRAFSRGYETMNARGGVRLNVEVADEIFVMAQPETLETILETLVDNACSFSPAGGHVTIDLKRDGDTAILTVEDDGPGVAQDRLDRIFDRYYSHRPPLPSDQDHPTDTQHFGIGLWLARQNAQSLGGEISACNRQPRGMRFVVLLPTAKA